MICMCVLKNKYLKKNGKTNIKYIMYLYTHILYIYF